MTFIRAHWQIMLLALAVFALSSTPALYPLNLLIIFFHELSHGLAALATGGSIQSLTISPAEGGLAVTIGGSRFLTLTAGYLGSLLFGVAMFFVALRTRVDRAAVATLGLCIWLIAALYIRDGFPLAFCVLIGLAFLLVAWFLGHGPNDLVLRIFGLASMFYVPRDIISDTITRSHLASDARMLAEEFGGATMLWGGVWLLISLVVIALTLRFGLGSTSNLPIGTATSTGRSVPGAK